MKYLWGGASYVLNLHLLKLTNLLALYLQNIPSYFFFRKAEAPPDQTFAHFFGKKFVVSEIWGSNVWRFDDLALKMIWYHKNHDSLLENSLRVRLFLSFQLASDTSSMSSKTYLIVASLLAPITRAVIHRRTFVSPPPGIAYASRQAIRLITYRLTCWSYIRLQWWRSRPSMTVLASWTCWRSWVLMVQPMVSTMHCMS